MERDAVDCRQLEDRLEALLDGALDAAERRRCDEHLAACAGCRELVAPLLAPRAAEPPPPGLLTGVMARTAAGACRQARLLACERLDGTLSTADGQLLAPHLERCGDCRAVVRVLTALPADLPALAELRPPHGFADAVLAATLPLAVRLRRWWRASWPGWVRRPRFASEAAFVATLVLVLVVATPGSPLEAVPRGALELARTDPVAGVEAPVAVLEQRLGERVRAVRQQRLAPAAAAVRGWAVGAYAGAGRLVAAAEQRLGTLRDGAASLLTQAGVALQLIEPPPPDSEQTDEETP